MRSDITTDQSASAVFIYPVESAPPPFRIAKKETTEQRAVLNQRIIDEYWNRTGTDDLEWARALAQRKLVEVSPAATSNDGNITQTCFAPPPETKNSAPTSFTQTTEFSTLSFLPLPDAQTDAYTNPKIARAQQETEQQSIDNLVDSTLLNVGALIDDLIASCVACGHEAFKAQNISTIQSYSTELSVLLNLKQRFHHAIQGWITNQKVSAAAGALSSPATELPGLIDMIKYLALRISSIDDGIVDALVQHDYSTVENLSKCAAKLSSLHSLLLELVSPSKKLDFSPSCGIEPALPPIQHLAPSLS